MDSHLRKKIILGSDHAGFKLKQTLLDYLNSKNKYDILDVGTNSTESVDFPDYAEKLSYEVLKNSENRGILVCGSGIGVSITANKIPGIRCALVHNHTTARLARQHTDCNVISMGETIIGENVAKDTVDAFLEFDFLKEEKYQRRIDKMTKIEVKLGTSLKNCEDNIEQEENKKI